MEASKPYSSEKSTDNEIEDAPSKRADQWEVSSHCADGFNSCTLSMESVLLPHNAKENQFTKILFSCLLQCSSKSTEKNNGKGS
jgi:hypothetical protein